MTKLEQYQSIFQKEKANSYLEVDSFEKECGYAVSRDALEKAAYPLACPLKVNPPSWQHGRVLYAKARQVLSANPQGILLDIGTAKGFSAVVLSWAAAHSEWRGEIASVDVIDPEERTLRNSYLEATGDVFSVFEFVAPYILHPVSFHGCGSVKFLHKLKKETRIPLAFVDGKHDQSVVQQEGKLIRDHQECGDVIVFDDLQIPKVAQAVKSLSGYSVKHLSAGFRKYAVATRT